MTGTASRVVADMVGAVSVSDHQLYLFESGQGLAGLTDEQFSGLLACRTGVVAVEPGVVSVLSGAQDRQVQVQVRVWDGEPAPPILRQGDDTYRGQVDFSTAVVCLGDVHGSNDLPELVLPDGAGRYGLAVLLRGRDRPGRELVVLDLWLTGTDHAAAAMEPVATVTSEFGSAWLAETAPVSTEPDPAAVFDGDPANLPTSICVDVGVQWHQFHLAEGDQPVMRGDWETRTRMWCGQQNGVASHIPGCVLISTASGEARVDMVRVTVSAVSAADPDAADLAYPPTAPDQDVVELAYRSPPGDQVLRIQTHAGDVPGRIRLPDGPGPYRMQIIARGRDAAARRRNPSGAESVDVLIRKMDPQADPANQDLPVELVDRPSRLNSRWGRKYQVDQVSQSETMNSYRR